MSILTSRDLHSLRMVRDNPCPTPGCKCMAWRTELADAVRQVAPEVSDAQLARILLRISAYTGKRTFERDLPGWAVGGIIAGAAADLAALELES